jgi:hypothetical protein
MSWLRASPAEHRFGRARPGAAVEEATKAVASIWTWSIDLMPFGIIETRSP